MTAAPGERLFSTIATFRALHAAALQSARGERRKLGAAAFLARLGTEVLHLERALLDGSWKPGGYTMVAVRDPKPRMV